MQLVADLCAVGATTTANSCRHGRSVGVADTEQAAMMQRLVSTRRLVGATLFIVETGERMLLWCEGGPSLGRAVHFPPPLEIGVEGGMYVLVDDGPPEQWRYQFMSETDVAG